MNRAPNREASILGSAINLAFVFVLALLCLVALLWDITLVRVMASLNMNDFGKFYYSARAFMAGADMYAASPATQLGGGQLPDAQQLLNLNPPHLHLLILPLARLTPDLAVTIWMTASVCALIVSVLMIWRELSLATTPKRVLLIALFILVFSGSQAEFITGQLAFLLLLPVTCCWRDARHRRWDRVGAWLGVLVSMKLFFLIFVPYLALHRRWRACGAMAATGALCFGIGLVVFGAASYSSWFGALARSSDWAWLGMNASTLGAFQRSFSRTFSFQPVAAVPALVSAWLVVAGLIGFTTLLVVFMDNTNTAIDRAFALLLVAAQLLSPAGWVYYLWLAVGPVAAVAIRFGRLRLFPRSTLGVVSVLPLAGFFAPITAPYYFQPSAWGSISIGSVFFWATLALWGLLVGDFARVRRELSVRSA